MKSGYGTELRECIKLSFWNKTTSIESERVCRSQPSNENSKLVPYSTVHLIASFSKAHKTSHQVSCIQTVGYSANSKTLQNPHRFKQHTALLPCRASQPSCCWSCAIFCCSCTACLPGTSLVSPRPAMFLALPNNTRQPYYRLEGPRDSMRWCSSAVVRESCSHFKPRTCLGPIAVNSVDWSAWRLDSAQYSCYEHCKIRKEMHTSQISLVLITLITSLLSNGLKYFTANHHPWHLGSVWRQRRWRWRHHDICLTGGGATTGISFVASIGLEALSKQHWKMMTSHPRSTLQPATGSPAAAVVAAGSEAVAGVAQALSSRSNTNGIFHWGCGLETSRMNLCHCVSL